MNTKTNICTSINASHLLICILLLLTLTKTCAQPIPLFYGTSRYGGQHGYGAIFKTNWANNGSGQFLYGITHVYSFDSISGSAPLEIIRGADNVLYGYTYSGGLANAGVVFSLDPATDQFTVLHQFGSTSEKRPLDMLYGADGNLYGLASGGTIGSGVIFKVDLSSGNYSVVHNFENPLLNILIGYGAPGKMIQASNGKLYGTTVTGGNNGVNGGGIIFSFDLTTNVFSELFVFMNNKNCYRPDGIVQGSNTKLYGNTVNGRGIFSYDIQTGVGSILTDTVGYNQLNPADNGLFYLTTATSLHTFNIVDNSVNEVDVSIYPEGYISQIIQASDYKLYGICPAYGPYKGKLFWVDIYQSNSSFNFHEFNSSSIYEEPNCLVEVPTINCNAYFQIYPDAETTGLFYGYNLSTGSNLSYLWNFGDGFSSSSYTPSHVYSQPGVYRVCLTVSNSNGCSDTFCDSSYAYKTNANEMSELIIQSNPLGINEKTVDVQISVYPNPAQSILNINTGYLKFEKATIYNLQGQVMSNIKQVTAQGIDISDLANGYYIIEIVTKDTTVKRSWVKI